MKKMKNVAIYGGAFDPPHKSHLSIITQIINIPFIDQVWLLPCGDRQDKKLLLNKNQRFNLLQLLTEQHRQKITVSDAEINLSIELKRMIQTAQFFQLMLQKHPEIEFHYVVGGDILSTINTWNGHEWLMKNISFIIFARKGFDLSAQILPTNYYLSPYIPDEISSSWIKKTLLDQDKSKEEKNNAINSFVESITINVLKEKGIL